MMMRAQRLPASWNPHHSDKADTTTTSLDPRSIASAGDGVHLAIISRVPGAGWHVIREPDGATSVLLFEADNPDGSWAACVSPMSLKALHALNAEVIVLAGVCSAARGVPMPAVPMPAVPGRRSQVVDNC
jgi:hypothetical protein